jgi:hypothetical protein
MEYIPAPALPVYSLTPASLNLEGCFLKEPKCDLVVLWDGYAYTEEIELSKSVTQEQPESIRPVALAPLLRIANANGE